MKIRRFLLYCAVVSLLWSAAFAEAPVAASVDAALNQLFATHNFRQVAISPDGARVAWVENLHGPGGEPSGATAIYVSDVAGKTSSQRVTASTEGDVTERAIAWAPDSRRLAFVSNASGRPQLYVADLAHIKAQPRVLTDLEGAFDDPRWSPDGTKLAFLIIENPPREAGPLAAMSPQTGEIEEHPFEQRLGICDLEAGAVRLVSPADLYVYEYDWSPDSKSAALIAAHGSGDNNWWIAQLYTMPVAGGQITSILKPAMQIAEPRWSPDGGSIAVIGGLMSDQGVVGGDVYLVPATGGEARDLTPGMHASADSIQWDPSRKQIVVVETVGGMAAIATLDPATAHLAELWRGAESVHAAGWGLGISLARDGRTSAVVRDSFERPPEVYAGAIGSWSVLTHANPNQHPAWGKVENIEWTSDQFAVQGWLIYPAHYDPQRKYPLVVVVHGGPSSAAHSAWPAPFLGTTLLSSQDYFVLEPNPRGSYGQGEAFTRANVKDFGYGDFRDILAGVDTVLKSHPIDPKRVGITGWSYGGYMTMWAVTQTQRFRAAIAGAGLADWLSYYGENDIDEWMVPFFGATVYDDPQVYARSAPMTFIKQAKTPTLVLVGERDGECPAPQSYEFWHALKTLGVPTRLVVYADEGHNIARSGDRRDIVHRMLDWFDRYMPPSSN